VSTCRWDGLAKGVAEVSYASYGLIDAGQMMDYTVRLLFTALVAGCACWFACYGICVAWVKARAVRRRRRAEAAHRAEVTRGLAEIERFLEAHAVTTRPSESPEAGRENKTS
jgi:hypothetical protein